MKNILLLVHDDAGQEARLQAALDLTRALEGHLDCLDVTPPALIAGDLYGGFGEAAIITDERRSESDNKQRLLARLSREGIEWDWSDATGEIARCILAAAALADLIVLNRQLDDHRLPDMRGITSRILMTARVPVLALPESTRGMALDRAVIAWDGRPSCIAAMRASIPLLSRTREVELFTADNGAIEVSPNDGAKYLSRHGIHATVRTLIHAVQSPEELIAQECERWGADYAIMGAYSRGRIMETLGGTTKDMLARAQLPLILCH